MSATPRADRPVLGSFRDPSGFVFWRDQNLYRQVNTCYASSYKLLMESGLYQDLVNQCLLIRHDEVDVPPWRANRAFKVIAPERIDFVSYPYEWCFSQLQDAALTTLRIQRAALERGMWLKDASAYNIQFHGGKPLLIDTLSFEPYEEGRAWPAYRQFCQHFLAPLAVASYRDIRLLQLTRVHLDGIPLDLAARLMPRRTWFRFGQLVHLHLHARSQRYFEDRPVPSRKGRVSRAGILGLVSSLESTVRKMRWRSRSSVWERYYRETNYSPIALEEKKKVVEGMVDKVKPVTVWDLGANVGMFSRICAQRDISTVSFDSDAMTVELNYRQCRRDNESRIVPLLLDLENPSAAIGWRNRERMSLSDRGPVDMVLALALIHHLVIGNNVPLESAAGFFSSLGQNLVVEFVPKTDSQVERMLASREDIFYDYTKRGFEDAFCRHFEIVDAVEISESERTLYLMRKTAEN